MNKNTLDLILNLRICIGLLGEVQQYPWWNCSFFSDTSNAFLSPVFSRTMVLVRYHGVTEAASIVHDNHIGIGSNVFHLFRLPEAYEKSIHDLVHSADINYDAETARVYLEKNSSKADGNSQGPVKVGIKSDMENLAAWRNVAGLYLNAFKSNAKVYPYFSGISR